MKEFAGIDNRDLFAYFEEKSREFAIEIQNLQEFINPIDPGSSPFSTVIR